MKSMSSALFAAALLALPALAMAQVEITGVSPSSRSKLDVYAHPQQAQPLRQIPVAELAFPLQSPGATHGFYPITLAGQQVWVRGAQVRVVQDNKAGCTTHMSAARPTISTPGASSAACAAQ